MKLVLRGQAGVSGGSPPLPLCAAGGVMTWTLRGSSSSCLPCFQDDVGGAIPLAQGEDRVAWLQAWLGIDKRMAGSSPALCAARSVLVTVQGSGETSFPSSFWSEEP